MATVVNVERPAPPVQPLLRAAATPMQIASIQFSVMSPDEIARASYMQVQSRDFYSPPDRAQTRGGALDPRLGAIDKRAFCETCHNNQADCVGHFGYIKLRLPVFHVGYFKATMQILQMICKGCARVLLDEETRERYIEVMRSPRISSKSHIRGSLLREVWTRARKTRTCPHCQHLNGTVKKTTILRLVHYPEGNKPPSKKKPDDEDDLIDDGPRGKHEAYHPEYDTAVEGHPELRRHIGKAADDLNPQRVMDLFQAIPPSDVQLLDMDPEIGRPEHLLVQYMPVPPLCIRPTVCADPTIGSTEDDLTMKAAEIVHINNIISQAMERGVQSQNVFENWDLLQHEVARYINSDQPGLPPLQNTNKPLRGISQRLKGKTGRFRGNLSGKRVDFSGRTVISPDPNLDVNQVGVPERVCKILTYPERITPYNIDRLRKAVINGPDVYPGANFATVPEHLTKRRALSTPGGDGTTKVFLRYGDRRKIAAGLKVGSIVERHLIDGDVALFNRQPSLHRVSIMCHQVKVSKHRTFRFNECVCNPYNADFDGDEMNLHIPQTEEARSEALQLMSVLANMVTPRNGEPLIAAIQDFITTSYLVTRRDIMMDRAEFCQNVCMMSQASQHVEIPPPAIIKPKELWTGKQLFTVLIRAAAIAGLSSEDKKAGSPARLKALRSVNADVAEKSFSLQGVPDTAPQMCAKDGFISFRGGELISGQLGKKSLGGGSKKSILYVLARECGPDAAAYAMNRLARFSARWLSNCGFSIGVDDVRPSAALSRRKQLLVDAGYQRCNEYLDDFKNNKLTLRPGCTPAQTLEAVVSAELSKIREDGGKACIAELDPRSNAALAMALSGSKGSNINISQMVSSVGQQTVGGSRAPDGFVGRALPHFPIGLQSREPAAKGFVQNSFFSGMTCTEFFFHTMGGREGLVDTAVKTAETGYMQRRLMKALEDLSVQYDGTVRASDGTLVQVRYGDDGLDPAEMEADDGDPVDFKRCMLDCTAGAGPGSMVDDRSDPFLSPEKLRLVVGDLLASLNKRLGQSENEEFVRKVGTYLYNIADNQEKQGLPAIENSDSDWIETVHAAHGMRKSQVEGFLERVRRKIRKSSIEPGSAVGAVGAQSIGEPGTQMTLKTFHFAGVASMNITLGVPRIKEIINASKNISTPILTAPLENSKKVEAARIVKGRVEETKLGEICVFIKEVYRRDISYLVVKVDTDLIARLQLELSIEDIGHAILAHNFPKIKVEPRNCQLIPSKFATAAARAAGRIGDDGMLIRLIPTSKVERVPSGDPSMMRTDDRRKMEENREHYLLQMLKQYLPNVTVAGIKGTQRAVINDVGDGVHNLLVEGDDLVRVMGVSGIVGTEVTCNHVMAVEPALGIEAARQTIMNEINYTMQSHGMSIDHRHVKLLADCMTASGTVLGITRFGIQKMRSSTLMLASFEMTVEHLFDAAIHSRRDSIVGVSERIIMGIPIPLGTGRFRMLRGASKMPPSRGTIVSGALAPPSAMEITAA